MQKRFRYVMVVVGLMVSSLGVQAQQTRETFGKNRIQYKQFEWQYLSSENFELYYYDGRRTVATEALNYLEGEFDRITDLIGYPPYLKTKIFLYNSVVDLQQSNVGLNHNAFNVSGETDFVKPYVEIAHPGTLDEFKEELLFKMTELMINEMMFGGSLKDMFQSSVFLNLPEWFINGVSLYVAKGWNSEMDDFARQLVKSRKVNKALRLNGKDGALAGQSIWNFIVEKYGKSSVSNILNYTRVTRNEQVSVKYTLGITFKQLMDEWEKFYLDAEQRVSTSYAQAEDSTKFSPRHDQKIVYSTVKISPDGSKIAYAENDRGKYSVKVKSLENGKETTVINEGNKVINQKVDYRMPLISWSDANTLGVIAPKRGEYIFWLYDLNTRTKIPRALERFSNVRSLDFSGNGRLVVVSADLNGQNDLFLISSRNDRTRRLTNDLYDDFDPAFIPNTNTIVFSSNRAIDTVNTVVKDYKKITSNFSLFAFDLDSTTNVVKRITNTVSKDYSPIPLDATTIFYLSDQRGIVNLFKFNRSSGIYTQVSNFESSIKAFDLDFYNRSLAMVMEQNMNEDIFLIRNFNLNRQIFTPVTKRKEAQQIKVITEKRQKESAKGLTIKELINSRLKEKTDTTKKVKESTEQVAPSDTTKAVKTNGVINTDDYVFSEDAVKPPAVTTPQPKPEDKTVNTQDYVFEDDATKTGREPSQTFLTRYMKARETNRITGPLKYEPRFSYENIVTDVIIDPLRGLSAKIETQMNDMLENFRFYGGMQISVRDLKSGDVYGEVQYLPHRIDYSVRFDRKVNFWNFAPTFQKYTYQKIEFGASLPLNVRTRISINPFVGFTKYLDRGDNGQTTPPVFMPAQQQYYAGSKIELVYDNSVTTGVNSIEGTRGKIKFVHHEALGDRNASFSQVSLDFRHYQKIYKGIVFAVRGYTGTFFGNSPKKYLLGGMDNWIKRYPGDRLNFSGTNNPLVTEAGYNDNLIFGEFVTNLRGFDLATLYGNNVAVGNVELRIPLVRALAQGSISSNFFRNLQMTAFYDIGSSWTGAPPFSSANAARTRVVPEGKPTGSPFRIEIKEYLNPWLYSYGVGLRTTMFGYCMKFDLAWPVENYTVNDPRLLFTLGYDF